MCSRAPIVLPSIGLNIRAQNKGWSEQIPDMTCVLSAQMKETICKSIESTGESGGCLEGWYLFKLKSWPVVGVGCNLNSQSRSRRPPWRRWLRGTGKLGRDRKVGIEISGDRKVSAQAPLMEQARTFWEQEGDQVVARNRNSKEINSEVMWKGLGLSRARTLSYLAGVENRLWGAGKSSSESYCKQ